ncbi:putative phytosulfokines 6 [Acorus calamus]|uniref:Phytosulfokine n=1 Tax=Acorus calamus TaxID=4465 RepID=A0AAV9DHZ8_ACOCL|nr:putative phytosulfokines 6 [Acorus calamus]
MKQSFHFHGLLFFFLVILLFIHTTTARYHMGLIKEGNTNTERPPQMGHSKEVQEEEDSFMMVLEDCVRNGGDECLKERLLSEAHLDYIYTQQQNP